MSQNPSETFPATQRLQWVEPEISQLDVKETSIYPFTGGDGYRGRPDCTRS